MIIKLQIINTISIYSIFYIYHTYRIQGELFSLYRINYHPKPNQCAQCSYTISFGSIGATSTVLSGSP